MIPGKFDYVRPSTVDEAVAALVAGGDDAKVLGGGQSLMPVLRLRMGEPSVIVDTTRIDEMKGITDAGDAVVIGAGVTHDDVAKNALVREHLALLAMTTEHVADRQIRHRGTMGGAMAHADPAGDQPPVALAMGASFTIAGPSGRRTVSAADFFVDYFTTAVGPDEVLVNVTFPKHTGWGAHYEKFNRTAQAWAIVGVAATVRMDGGSIAEARIGLTNMGPGPVRASGVEAALVGASTLEAIAAAAEHAAEGTSPNSDIHAEAEYREHLARVLTRRAVAQAAGL
ncbi:MAG TPA: carbon monoxide dehydrogenase [Actinobacteria bacterium]|jgi:carbon-monoxide dehydrogenase medium subunit|nr:carbon monoxide dehydrogenase [Actinomycetota bacterium]